MADLRSPDIHSWGLPTSAIHSLAGGFGPAEIYPERTFAQICHQPLKSKCKPAMADILSRFGRVFWKMELVDIARSDNVFRSLDF
jgi:hypothetical protein